MIRGHHRAGEGEERQQSPEQRGLTRREWLQRDLGTAGNFWGRFVTVVVWKQINERL